MKVKNLQKGPRGLNTTSGPVLLEPGEERNDLEIGAADLRVAKATGWFEIDGKASAESAEFQGLPSYEAKHVGGGSYFIMDGDNRVGEAMKKEDAEAFNALSDEEKAKFAAKG
jgi:hypothetical protein